MKITLNLPIPVSINHAYKNAGKRRALTARSQNWKWQAMHQLHNDGTAAKYAALISHNKNVRDQCTIRMGKKFKVSIYELRKLVKKEYALTYRLWFPDDALRDVANFEKLLTDFLCEHGLLVDDQFIKEMHLMRMDIDEKNPRAEVEILSLDGKADS